MDYKFNYFCELLNSMNGKEYFENFIIYNTSLVTSGAKPASTLNIIKNNEKGTYDLWCKYGEEILREINLMYTTLRENDTSKVILIYNKELLRKLLNKEEIKKLLINLGYDKQNNTNAYLNKLKDNYKVCNCPHELGIFLGYPIDDVIDFIYKTNKKCLASKYWKVYNNYEYAKHVFYMYDMAKEFTIDNIINGSRKVTVVSDLRNLFYIK